MMRAREKRTRERKNEKAYVLVSLSYIPLLFCHRDL